MPSVVKKDWVAFLNCNIVNEMGVKCVENGQTGRLLILKKLDIDFGHLTLADEVVPHIFDILHGSMKRIARIVVYANEECEDGGHNLVLIRLITRSSQWGLSAPNRSGSQVMLPTLGHVAL